MNTAQEIIDMYPVKNRSTLVQWVKRGYIQGVKKGGERGMWLFDDKSVHDHLNPKGYTSIETIQEHNPKHNLRTIRRAISESGAKKIYRNKRIFVKDADLEKVEAKLS